MCGASLFHICSDLRLGEVVIESSKSILVFFRNITCLLVFKKLHSPRFSAPLIWKSTRFALRLIPFLILPSFLITDVQNLNEVFQRGVKFEVFAHTRAA